MNFEKLNQNLISAIKDKLAYEKHTNFANELMDILSIGKEAIYRRLRNEVPFTFLEAALVAKKLNISLDTLLGETLSKNISFEFIPTRHSDLKNEDYYQYEEYLSILETAKDYDESEVMYASNLFPHFPGFMYNHLIEFYSFKWSYMHNSVRDVKPYHEVHIPDRIIDIKKRIIDESFNVKNTCCIWDTDMFSGVINDIKFFSSIDYIRNEDIVPIVDDMMLLIDTLEVIATKGAFETGNKVQIYVSNTNFDTTYSYLNTVRYKLSMIGAFGLNYLVALDQESFNKMKFWTRSLKKLSTLISESGEIQRAHFFKKQREIVRSLK